VKRIAFLALCFGAATLHAHDFWIEPSSFHPAPGATVAVRLRNGENLDGNPVGRSSKWIERFALRQNGRDTEIAGIEGSDPAGWLTAGKPPAVIVYRSRPSRVELPAARFEPYLREHGLERVIELRAKQGTSSQPGRERFSRCAKSLLGGTVAEATGLKYEIVAEELTATNVRGRVLFDGQPLAGALVVAQSRRNPTATRSARSDAKGAFSLPLDQKGMWLIKSVHMIPAPPRSDADWESFWASLTFEMQ